MSNQGKELADDIVAMAKEYVSGGLTHGMLINRFGDRMRGDLSVVLEPSNIVIFVGVSEELLAALELLKQEQPPRLVVRPVEMLVLLIDGCPIPRDMPLAKRRPRCGGFKKPHFLPTCLDFPDWEERDKAWKRRRAKQCQLK